MDFQAFALEHLNKSDEEKIQDFEGNFQARIANNIITINGSVPLTPGGYSFTITFEENGLFVDVDDAIMRAYNPQFEYILAHHLMPLAVNLGVGLSVNGTERPEVSSQLESNKRRKVEDAAEEEKKIATEARHARDLELRKTCTAEKVTETLRATIPFDVWVLKTYNEKDGILINHRFREFSPLQEKINEYAGIVGLGGIIAASKVKRIEDFVEKCQINTCQDVRMHAIIERGLPALTQPLTLYRVFINYFKAPEINTLVTLNPYTAFSLSQSYVELFNTGKEGVFVRCDVMPGIHVLPALKYHSGGSVYSEFEILVNGKYQVHALDPRLVAEGRSRTMAAPIYYGDNEPTKFENYSQITAFFVLSLPGACYTYYPEHDTDQTIVVGMAGGRKKIVLNARNSIGIGDVNSIIHNYLKKMKFDKTRVRKRKSLKIRRARRSQHSKWSRRNVSVSKR